MVTHIEGNVSATLLQTFDRLFDKAMTKLNLECSEEERQEARESFLLRFREALDLIQDAGGSRVSSDALREMETAIDLAKRYRNIDSIIVGNETLYRSSVFNRGPTVQELIAKIQKVKHPVLGDVLTEVPVKTYENVSQFWKWKPEEFLKHGPYKR